MINMILKINFHYFPAECSPTELFNRSVLLFSVRLTLTLYCMEIALSDIRY